MRRLSIKWRVTLWYTGFFAALSALLLVFVYSAGARMTVASLQRGLVDAVMEACDEIEFDGTTLEVDDDVEDFDGVSILVYNRYGQLHFGRRPSGFAAPIDPGKLQTVVGNGHDWYVYDLSVAVEGYGDVVVRGITSSAAARLASSWVLSFALIAFPFLIVIAGAGGYQITKWAFLPVKRITDTAGSISSGDDLSKRFDMGGVRDEIYTLAKTFDDMFGRLEQAFLSEKRFTADASHELRTPTAVIIAQCEYALSRTATQEDQKAALQVVLDQAREMSALIAQLLALARMDAGRQKVELEEVDLGFVLQSMARDLAPEAKARQITIHTDVQPGLLLPADHTLITRMFLNLITNAIGYGKPQGAVWITAGQEAGQLVCSVRDNGVGIPPDQLDNIWERFYRIDLARAPREGFGLGLPMVRWIAQAHGGTAEVQSTPGSGSTFTIRLPLPPP